MDFFFIFEKKCVLYSGRYGDYKFDCSNYVLMSQGNKLHVWSEKHVYLCVIICMSVHV